jgi:hypothetical protein
MAYGEKRIEIQTIIPDAAPDKYQFFLHPRLDVLLYWHPNVENDPGNAWLREQIISIAKQEKTGTQPQKRSSADFTDYTDLGFEFRRVDFQVVLLKKQDFRTFVLKRPQRGILPITIRWCDQTVNSFVLHWFRFFFSRGFFVPRLWR